MGAVFGLEEQYVGGIDAVLDCACCECVERCADGVEDRDGADAGPALRTLELVARVGTLDTQ